MAIPLKIDEAVKERDQLMELIEKDLLYPVYQPIIDVCRNNVCGYEVLTRGQPPLESPGKFLEVARENDLAWEIEHACRMSFLRDLISNTRLHGNKYFINVSPSVFIDQRFHQCFSAQTITAIGMKAEQIVMEITERDSIEDYKALQKSVKYFKSQGFAIALDDLGSGHSGLRTLTECTPDYLKLDMSLVRDISKDPYKQQMVRFLCDFASQVQAKIVAEGVETWAELLTLLRLGIRLFQGFLFSPPVQSPTVPDTSLMEKLRIAWNEFHYEENDQLEGLASLIIRGYTIKKGTMTCEKLHYEAKNSVFKDHLVILEDGRPYGFITRQSFFLKTGGAFGYDLYQKKPVEEICKRDFLSVKFDSSIRTLSKLAMERKNEDIYDPVVVVDSLGYFLGTVTMKQLIIRSSELEVEKAMNSNPLSGLPGNRHIENWIFSYQKNQQLFTLIYADLDKFKQYNDRYGFLCGDKLIQATANILIAAKDVLPSGSRVGHIGGDDFVCVCPGEVLPEVLDGICVEFDRLKMKLFSSEDITKGFYEAKGRNGESIHVPLVTLSLAVLESRRFHPNTHPARIAEIAAGLKHKVKENTGKYGRSSFLFERRSYI
jgi:diguanylate cyclase (GGDEF)-like protein